MTTVYCAVCLRRFEPDQDYVKVTGERQLISDRNTTDEFAMHTDCWRSVSGGWMDPA